MRHGAVGAIARANVTQNHERRGTVFPTLANIWTVCFLAHRVQIEVLHELLEAHVICAARCLHLKPLWLSFWQRVATVATHDLMQQLGHVLREGRLGEPGGPG